MPVVACSCGKRLNLNDELAGKQVRCPGCSVVITVPRQSPPTSVADEDEPILLTCSCGSALRVNSSFAGKAIRCPKCSETNRVPDANSAKMNQRSTTSRVSSAEPTRNVRPAASKEPRPEPLRSQPEQRPARPKRRVAVEKYDDAVWEDPYANGPVLPPVQGSVSKPVRKTSASTSPSKSSSTVIWVLVAVFGGGVLLALGLGLIVVIAAIANRTSDFDSEVSQYSSTAAGGQTLVQAKAGFSTQIVSANEPYGPPDDPAGSEFDLIKYQSPVGPLHAYVTRDPGDGRKRPAIVWITGGDCNSIGDVWSPSDPSDDQTASAFRKAGVAMMFPSLRGGNDNPGRREGLYGEVDDVLAAAEHLSQMPHINRDQIYLGGHSTGGTLAMLVAESSDRFKAVFSLGPVSLASHYGGEYVYCNPDDKREIAMRSPLPWLHCVKSPLYVFEGGDGGNWESIEMMKNLNTNAQIHFFEVPRHDHFTVISPLTTRLASQVAQGQVNVTEQIVQGL